MSMIVYLYGKHYHIKELFADPSDQGHQGANRFRIWIIMWLKQDVQEVLDIHAVYDAIVARTKSLVQTVPKDYLISSTSELLREATHLAQLRKKKLKALFSLLLALDCHTWKLEMSITS